MLHREYETQVCSIARTLEVVGERWSLLLIRSIGLGIHRFDDLKESLGITRSVLTSRLKRLADEGVIERVQYLERPPRFEYRLTEKGRDLWPTMIQMVLWGDRYYPEPEGPPRFIEHTGCGGRADHHLNCDKCGEPLELGKFRAVPGPALIERGLVRAV